MDATVIFGCPGSGKTHDLKTRIERLESEGVNPINMMVLSHTKAAAKEITKRAPQVKASTIHSLAFQSYGYSREQVINEHQMDEFKAWIHMSDKYLDDYMAIYQLAQNLEQEPKDVYHKSFRPGTEREFIYFYESYNNWKKAYGFIDFNDMLLALASGRNVWARDRITHLFIDEAQDLSSLQWRAIDTMIEAMGVEHLVIVGDPDQAIYVWGGAMDEGMGHAAARYNAKVENMGRSYRVPVPAAEEAYKVISSSGKYKRPPFEPTNKPGTVVRAMSPYHIDFSGDDVLILFRTHYSGQTVENELIDRGIAYTRLGVTGPCQNKYAHAVKILRKLQKGSDLTGQEIDKLKASATSWAKNKLQSGDFSKLDSANPSEVINLPPTLTRYYDTVDLSKAGKIRVSTIHGSKGMEADNVIVYTGITNRVQQEAMINQVAELRVWYVALTRTKKRLSIWEGNGGMI